MRTHALLSLTSLLILLTLLSIGKSTLSKSDKKDKKPKKKSKEAKPLPRDVLAENVRKRGLVNADHGPEEILKEYHQYSQLEVKLRHFNGPVLAYVTPWNGKGYDIAKIFNKKFTHVSPVWLQVAPERNGKYAMTGGHDIDKNWAQQVASGGETTMAPRVLFDKWSITDYQTMFSSEAKMGKCAKTITSFIKKQGFGGVTIEIWSQMPQMLQSDVSHFLIDLAGMLHQADKILIVVVPPLQLKSSENSPTFTKDNFEELKDSVDFFSVMTYDYHAQSGIAGPISPLPWVEQTITALCPDNNKYRAKLLLGINFYGMKFGQSIGAAPVVGHEFINILSTQGSFAKWQEKEAEHVYMLHDPATREQMYMFYPSLLFIEERLNLAKRLGTGISIWEIGQGLDYFYDLL